MAMIAAIVAAYRLSTAYTIQLKLAGLQGTHTQSQLCTNNQLYTQAPEASSSGRSSQELSRCWT